MFKKLKIYVDIDDTICFYEDGLEKSTIKRNYRDAIPHKKNISKINKLYDEGHEITYYTARGAVTKIDWFGVTKNQLDNWGCKYHALYLGKPASDYYIDDKAWPDHVFFNDKK